MKNKCSVPIREVFDRMFLARHHLGTAFEKIKLRNLA